MIDIRPKYNLSIIVAVAQNMAIGRDNDLLWHISDDLKRFKSLTGGHTVIMGRRTFDSLPKKPLPKRRNIVLTHDEGFRYDVPETATGTLEVAHSMTEVLRLVEGEEETLDREELQNLLLEKDVKIYIRKDTLDILSKKTEDDRFDAETVDKVVNAIRCTFFDLSRGLLPLGAKSGRTLAEFSGFVKECDELLDCCLKHGDKHDK